jgi:transposase
MQLSSVTRAQISVLHEAGWIQKEITEYFKVSQTTISKVLRKIKDTGSFDHKRGNSRPKKVSTRLGNIILKKIKETPTLSLRKLSKKLETDHIELGLATVQWWITSMKAIFMRSCQQKPDHVKRRLELAKQFLFMDEEACKSQTMWREDWNLQSSFFLWTKKHVSQ